MLLCSLLDTLTTRPSSRGSRRAANSRGTSRLAVESLEDRLTPAAMLTIGDASVVEGATHAVVQVNLTEPHGNAVTVNFSTVNGSATAGNDFNAVSGKLSFTKNELSKTIQIPLRDDRVFEFNESFTVRLSNAKGAKIADGVGNVAITDNDPRISVTNNWYEVEGNSGTKEFKFTVSLSSAYDQTVTVDFTTMDGTATAADNDYEAKNGTLTFEPGRPTSQDIIVVVNGDYTLEGDETFQVILSNPSSNAQISDGVGDGVIYDDEPLIYVSNWYETEGNSGVREFKFTVSMSTESDETVTVDFTTADGSATTADNDYVPKNVTVTFEPGQPTSQEVTVLVNGDLALEDHESFQVNLTNASSNAQIGTGVAYGTIYDDDTPWINTSDVWYYYDSSIIVFTVTLAVAPVDEAVTVDFTTIDGSAVAGWDYVGQSGTLTFGIGETTQYIWVDVLNSNYTDIYFHIQLSNASPPAQLGTEWATAYWYYDYYYYDPGYYYYDYYYYDYYYW